MEKVLASFIGIFAIGLFSYFKKSNPITYLTSSSLFNDELTMADIMDNGNINMTRAQTISQAKSGLRQSFIEKEGYRNDVYKDSLGKLTVGIGHLVLPSDNLNFGDIISDQRVEQLYYQDSNKALNAAIEQADELGKFNSDFIVALAHVNFQLGTGWTKTFSSTWGYLRIGNYSQAIKNLLQSQWNTQTPVRVAAFTEAIQEVYTA